MKNLLFLSLICVVCLYACTEDSSTDVDIIEYSEVSSNDLLDTRGLTLCRYNLTSFLTSLGNDGLPCETTINFLFVSETGEEFHFSYIPANGPPPEVILPAGKTYSIYITSQEGQSSCGDFEWIFESESHDCNTNSIAHYVEERPDLIALERPDHIVTIPLKCTCPTVEPTPDPEPEVCFCRCYIESHDGSQEWFEYVIDCDQPVGCDNHAFATCEFVRR